MSVWQHLLDKFRHRPLPEYLTWRLAEGQEQLGGIVAEAAACLYSWNVDERDEQMKRDLTAGKLDKLLGRVDADVAENKTRGMQ
jgi:hypothetical protein